MPASLLLSLAGDFLPYAAAIVDVDWADGEPTGIVVEETRVDSRYQLTLAGLCLRHGLELVWL